MGVIVRRNDALEVNPPAGNEQFSVEGSDWLWAVTSIYGFLFLAYYGLSFRARFGEKVFHYIFSITLLTGTIAYFAHAADLGYTVVNVDSTTRQIFWVKYVYWLVEFPAISISLGLLSGVSWATIVYNVFLSWTWIVTYIISAFTPTDYKWGFYAFGTFAYLILAYNTLWASRAGASRVGVGRDHTLLAGWVNLLWLLWPIAYGVSDGSNVIGVTPGAVFFGVLDVLLAPVVAIGILVLSRSWDYGRLNLAFTRYGRVQDAGSHPEKDATATSAAAPAVAPATAPTTAPVP